MIRMIDNQNNPSFPFWYVIKEHERQHTFKKKITFYVHFCVNCEISVSLFVVLGNLSLWGNKGGPRIEPCGTSWHFVNKTKMMSRLIDNYFCITNRGISLFFSVISYLTEYIYVLYWQTFKDFGHIYYIFVYCGTTVFLLYNSYYFLARKKQRSNHLSWLAFQCLAEFRVWLSIETCQAGFYSVS